MTPSAANLTTPYTAAAIYYDEADMVEYVRADVPSVATRVDNMLTLIHSMKRRDELIGFKLKGFKNFYLREVLPKVEAIGDEDFLMLVTVFETAIKKAADGLFEERQRKEAYQQARRMAFEDKVILKDFKRA